MVKHIELLLNLYENLKNTYKRSQSGKIEDSVYFALLNLGSQTRRMRLLLDAAIPAISLKHGLLEKLIKLNYVEYIDRKMKITLTSIGIWEAEKRLNIINSEQLTNFIEKKWFNCFADFKQPLSEKEKIILLTTLAIRAFSKDSAVDLKNEKFHTGWADAVSLACEFLYENKITSDKKIKDILLPNTQKKMSLHPVIHFFRYSEYLPKKTNGIYIAKGNNNYYLDIYRESRINIDNLVFLFDIIFQDKKNYILMDKVYEFCQKSSYDISVKVFPLRKHIFSTPDYDDLIRKALRELIVSST